MKEFARLREAIEASWDEETAFENNFDPSNPSMGQCYVTSWVLQQYFSELEIYEGQVDTGSSEEKHFWTALDGVGGGLIIDLTWQQFPLGSKIISSKHRDRKTLNDGPQTLKRCSTLLGRVEKYLEHNS